jgi:CobQ-like glutamine amidotransferase family enzyme
VSGQALTLVHLYPEEMNLYGDTGNVLALRRRCEWRGIGLRTVQVEPGDRAPLDDADLLFMGGGQDRGQEVVADDLAGREADLYAAADTGLPTLLVCGGYQLFGRYFDTVGGTRLPGVGVLDAVTTGARERLIGNVVADATPLAEEEARRRGDAPPEGQVLLVGFENHSGRTVLGEGTSPLARVVRGRGNDGSRTFEGAVRGNVFGTYLHGSLLPKNPWFADLLLSRALDRRAGRHVALEPLDDALEEAAARRGASRARRRWRDRLPGR